MAIFNPQVQPAQDTAPSYLGYSKGIDGGFGVDKSKGVALETIGQGITEGTTIVDTGIKDYLKNNVRDTVEKQRDDYTSYLQTLKGMQQANTIPGADASGDSLMDANASADMPAGLEAGLDRAKAIAAASTTGNRINDTLYTANLASAASQLRTNWPGYKDYIDSKFAEYSGMNPANAYYKNLMQDINTLANRKATDAFGAKSIINKAVNDGVDNADKIWTLHKAGKITDDDAIAEIFKSTSAKATATALEAQRVARKGDRDDTAAVATRDFTKEFGDKVNRDMGLIQIGTGTKSLKDAVNWLTSMAQDPNAADPKQVQAVVTALKAKRDELYQSGMTRATERDSTGQTYATRMGGIGRVKDEIEGNLVGLDQYITSVNDQKWGIGTYVQRRMAAQGDIDQRSLLEHPTLGPPMRKVATLNKIAPNYGDVFVKAGLVGNIPEDLNTYFSEKRIDAATQPDFLSGKVNTMKKDFDDIDKKITGNPSKYSPIDAAKLKNEAFNIPSTIADPKAPMEVKANIARHAFDPENIGILQGIKMDYTDPNTKRYIPGKYSAFTRMTSPDITENMWKMRGSVQDGGQLWDNYKNWTGTEFQKLFREDAANLTGLNDSRLHIGWNSGEGGQPPRMKLLNERGEELSGAPPTWSIGQAQRTVQRINSAMYNLHQVYSKEGTDTNMPILQDMTQNWTPTEKTTGLPAKIMDAIILGNKSKLQKMEDTFHPGAKE